MVVWLVDYDFPKNPTRYRVRFHRHLKKVIEQLNGGRIKYSSQSVIITDSEELAKAIHELAKENNARKTTIYSINGGWNEVSKYVEEERARLIPGKAGRNPDTERNGRRKDGYGPNRCDSQR